MSRWGCGGEDGDGEEASGYDWTTDPPAHPIECVQRCDQLAPTDRGCEPECDELGSELNAKAALEDVGHNADLYIANQEDNTQN